MILRKILSGIIISLWLTPVCLSQTVTIANESAPVEYYRMPDEPLDPSYTTYSSDVEARYGGLAMTGYSETSLVDQYLVLSGYKKVSRDGDVEIEASIGDFNVHGERRDVRRTKRKEKDGKEVVKLTYAIEIRYALPISVKVTDKKGNTLVDENIFSWSDDRIYTTSYYNSLSELDSYWRINRTSRLSDLQRDMVKEGFNKIYDLINNKYGYRLMNENAKFEAIGKKKHPGYDKYQSAVETIKEAFKTMKADKGLGEIKNKVKPALAFYNTEGQACGTRTKDDIKLKHINLYNQALAYYWLEEFDLATQFALEIQKFAGKDKDAKRLLEDIDYARSSLERANKKSRHGVMVGGKA